MTPLPSGGTVPDPNTERELERVRNTFPLQRQHIGDEAIGSDQVEDGSLTDTDLASPNNVTYKTIVAESGGLIGGTVPVVGTYILGTGNDNQNSNMIVSGANIIGAAVTGINFPKMIDFDDADYAVAGKTTRLRIRYQLLTNATAPTRTYTAGLYPVSSVAGGANALTITLGSVVSGSTVAIATPGASSETVGNSGDFTVPSDERYLLCVALSGGTQAANAVTMHTAQLQTRNT